MAADEIFHNIVRFAGIPAPNQRWCWDISYLPTHERGIFLYLLLDEYSRKALAWRISWQQTMEEARELLDDGMRAENILDLPEDQRPEVFNDRGRQMKAKPIKRMLEDMKMPQRFARGYLGQFLPMNKSSTDGLTDDKKTRKFHAISGSVSGGNNQE